MSIQPEDCAPDCEERTACTQAQFGHSQCGMCATHNEPKHHCGCVSVLDSGDPIEDVLSQGYFLDGESTQEWFDRQMNYFFPYEYLKGLDD